MPKNFAQKTFERWVRLNRKNFRRQPKITGIRKNYFELKFDGVTPQLACHISSRGDCRIIVCYQGEHWDIIWEADLQERCNREGRYFCDGCLPEYKKFYPSRQALWEDHCFRPLMEWTNEHLDKSQWLYLFARGNSTWAELRRRNETVEAEECLVYSTPLVQSGHDLYRRS